MALAGDVLKSLGRGIATASPGGRAALRMGMEQRAAEQERRDVMTERLVNLRQMVPDDSREAQELDAKLAELRPDLAQPSQPRAVMDESGFIQHEPGGVESIVSESPESQANRAEREATQAEQQRGEDLRRSAAAQIQRMQRIPEDIRGQMAQQAMVSDDPESVLSTAREYGRQNVKASMQGWELDEQGNAVRPIQLVRTDQGVRQQVNDPDAPGGVRLTAPPERYTTVETRVEGTPDEVLPSGEQTKLRDQKVAAMNFVDTTGQALNLLQENPDINTWTARGAALINNLQQEGKAMARAAGMEFNEDVLDPSNYQNTFDDLGIQSDRMKSLFVSLAFQAATASGQTGRSVSDRDVERFMRQVGQSSSDPRAMAQVLRDTAERTVNNYRNSVRARTGEDPQSDLGLSQLPTYESPNQGGEVGTRENPATPQTQEDYEALPSGAYFRDDEGLKVKP